MAKRKVLFVFPTAWDARQLESCRLSWGTEYDVEFGEPDDAGCRWDFDVVKYIGEAVELYRGTLDGVISSSDYPGATVAGAMASRLGLPGPTPESVIRCSHKYYSRLLQRESVPEATPQFHLVDPRSPQAVETEITFPCFIKPVKGAFSVMSQKLASPTELRDFLDRPATREFMQDYVAIFNQLVAQLTTLEIGGSFFLAEGFLHGTQVTVEGFEQKGNVEIIGIVDSIMYPGTGSFARFDYPSALRPEIQERMHEIARRVVPHVGLRDALFNIEMIYDPASDAIHIIEINPRLSGQFGDLYQKVDGVSSYRIALDVATGQAPTLQRGNGKFAMATSFALRLFEPVHVRKSPSVEYVRQVEAQHVGALIWCECEAGQDLADFERLEDGASYRYAVVNVGGNSRAELLTNLDATKKDLSFDFEPLA